MATDNIVSFKSLIGDEWRFSIQPEPLSVDGSVWLHISAGPGSASLFLTVDQARAIAHKLQSAADQVDIARAHEGVAA